MAENGTPTKRINCNKTDFATKERMLGLPDSVKGPVLLRNFWLPATDFHILSLTC